MTQNEGDGSSEIGKLSVEGNKNDGTAADGSIVSVEAGAKFVMTTGVTLSKNVSTAAGAAVKNSGKLVITGGEIKDNVSTGGAVYSTGTISWNKERMLQQTNRRLSRTIQAEIRA